MTLATPATEAYGPVTNEHPAVSLVARQPVSYNETTPPKETPRGSGLRETIMEAMHSLAKRIAMVTS